MSDFYDGSSFSELCTFTDIIEAINLYRYLYLKPAKK